MWRLGIGIGFNKEPMMIQPNDTILFQGDSITDCGRGRDVAGANDSHGLGRGYAMIAASAVLASRPADNVRVFNRGISGNRIVDLYARWREDALNLQPSVISILIGVNDTWHHFNRNAGVAVAKYERMYRALLQETREANPRIRFVLCEPFVLRCGVVKDEWIGEMNERRAIVKRLAGEFDAVFVPFQSAFDEAVRHAPPEYWAGDGVHPSPAGHMLMARTWLKATGQAAVC
jgi:lysophospholipase L1-like esterase